MLINHEHHEKFNIVKTIYPTLTPPNKTLWGEGVSAFYFIILKKKNTFLIPFTLCKTAQSIFTLNIFCTCCSNLCELCFLVVFYWCLVLQNSMTFLFRRKIEITFSRIILYKGMTWFKLNVYNACPGQ